MLAFNRKILVNWTKYMVILNGLNKLNLLDYQLDQKVLGLVTAWRSRSADFNSSFFVVLVEVSLTFCQIFSLIAWHLLKWRCIVYTIFVCGFDFSQKNNVIVFAAMSLH